MRASFHRPVVSADQRAVQLLLTVPVLSDAFHAVLLNASASALQEAVKKCAVGSSRRKSIAVQLSILAPARPPRHD